MYIRNSSVDLSTCRRWTLVRDIPPYPAAGRARRRPGHRGVGYLFDKAERINAARNTVIRYSNACASPGRS